MPRLQLAATERQWTSTDVEIKSLVEIRSDLSRSSNRSGRSWTSLNVLGWWAVGDSGCPSNLDPRKT
jgi:hypothetical protein